MNKHTFKRWLTVIAALILLTVLSSFYSVIANESRWVVPMDLSAYQFRVQDLPMLISVGLLAAAVTVFILSFILAVLRQKQTQPADHTRRLNPKFGLLGFLGFLGCFGFWTYAEQQVIFPFFFFIFFGFFGFYYEGKMSGTLTDEMFEMHRMQAQLKAYKIGMSLIFLTLWLIGFGLFRKHLDWAAIFLTSGVSLSYGLTLFLSEYFLYRFEHED